MGKKDKCPRRLSESSHLLSASASKEDHTQILALDFIVSELERHVIILDHQPLTSALDIREGWSGPCHETVFCSQYEAACSYRTAVHKSLWPSLILFRSLQFHPQATVVDRSVTVDHPLWLLCKHRLARYIARPQTIAKPPSGSWEISQLTEGYRVRGSSDSRNSISHYSSIFSGHKPASCRFAPVG